VIFISLGLLRSKWLASKLPPLGWSSLYINVFCAAKIHSPEFRLHGVMTSAASTAGAKDKTEPETDSTF